LFSNAYEIDDESDPIKLKVVPVKKRVETVSNDDVKDGLSHNAIYTNIDAAKLESMSKEERSRFMAARRQRRKQQTNRNLLTTINEYVF